LTVRRTPLAVEKRYKVRIPTMPKEDRDSPAPSPRRMKLRRRTNQRTSV